MVWEKTYNVNLESLKGDKKHLRHSEYTIYTDGSKKQEGTGGGFVIYNYNKQIHTQSFKLHDHATVYQAELEAIYQACKYMDNNYDTIKPKYVKNTHRLTISTESPRQHRFQIDNGVENS